MYRDELSSSVEFVGLGQNRIRFVNTPENEMFVKPSQMPDLPEQWIDDVEPRPHQLIVVEAVNQLNRAPPGILEIGPKFLFVSLSLISQQSIGRL